MMPRRELEYRDRRAARRGSNTTWADPPGLYGWFTHVDHKSIGRRYLVTAFAFFLHRRRAGGADAAAAVAAGQHASSGPTSTTRSSPRTARR